MWRGILLCLVVASTASAVLLPTDNLRGENRRYWTAHFGGSSGSWPTVVDVCLRSTGSGGFLGCPVDEFDERYSWPYGGQPMVETLDCTPTDDHELWDGTGPAQSLSLALFEATGGSASLAYERNQVGGSVTFTSANPTGKTEPLAINQRVSIVDGLLLVKLSAFVAGGGQTAVEHAFSCVAHGYY